MNKKISVLIVATAISAAFCLSACGGDKNKETKATTTQAATTAAATTKQEETQASSEATSETAASQNADSTGSIPKEGDTYKGKKVGSVEKVPDCDDDKHGVIYIYDENEELIEAIKY